MRVYFSGVMAYSTYFLASDFTEALQSHKNDVDLEIREKNSNLPLDKWYWSYWWVLFAEHYPEFKDAIQKGIYPLPKWIVPHCVSKISLIAIYECKEYTIPIYDNPDTSKEFRVSWHTEESDIDVFWTELCKHYAPQVSKTYAESFLEGWGIDNLEWRNEMLEFMLAREWYDWVYVHLHAVLWLDKKLERFNELIAVLN